MRRHHFIELHEQSWVPSQWRQMFQSGLGIAGNFLKPFRQVASKLEELLQRTGSTEILDLCSGSGDAILQLQQCLGSGSGAGGGQVRVVLSDLFPHLDEWHKLQMRFPGLVSFRKQSTDVFDMPMDVPKVWTLLNSLHHFREEEVKRLLQNVVAKADGVAVFESTGRTWSNMFQTLPLFPVAAVIASTMLRPFRIWHPLWGAMVPVVPFMALFDGIVSNFRTYTVDELKSLVASLGSDDFEWDIGTAPMDKTTLRATYLIGWRKKISTQR